MAWESLIEFKETEPPSLAIQPKPPEPRPAEAAGKPPRSWWPIIAAASAAASVLLGIIITIVSRGGGKTSVDIPADRAVKGTIDGVAFEHTPPPKAQADARTSETSPPDLANVPARPTVTLTAGPAAEVHGGAWTIEGNELVQSEQVPRATLVFGDPTWSHYDFKFKAMSTGGTHGFKAKFHWSSPRDFCEFAVGDYRNTYDNVCFVSAGKWGRAKGMGRRGHVDFNRWYDVRVGVRGPEFRCYLDGTLMFQGRYDQFSAGRVGLGTHDNTARFRDIEVTTPDGKILWRGLPTPPGGPSTGDDAPAGPIDHLQAGSAWSGTRTYRKGAGASQTVAYELNITEWTGAKFIGHALENRRDRSEVEGELDGASIAWQERADRGGNQVLRTRGTLSGDTLTLTFDNNYVGAMAKSGDGTLHWVGGGQDAPEGSTPRYVPIFNKRDIAGWRAWGKQREMSATEMKPVWTVRDGDLIGSGEPSHLFSPRGDYADFRVRAEVKVNEKGNSGLYFRAQPGLDFPQGYEAQINATGDDPVKTGSLYKRYKGAVVVVKPSPVPSNTWFTLEVEAVGPRIRIRVDGKLTADWTDPEPIYSRGHFAIQLNNPHTQVQVRKLEVMELDASGRPVGGQASIAEVPGGDRAPKPQPTTIAGQDRPLDIRHVPIRPGLLRISSAPPGAFWPDLTPRDTEKWRVGDASLVSMGPKGLVVEGGTAGNFLLTSRSDYKKCAMTVDLSATEGTEAYLILRADEGPDGWRGVTSRIVDEGGKIRAGLQSLDFAAPERGGDPKGGDSRADFKPGFHFGLKFSIDETNRATVIIHGKPMMVAHEGPRRLDAAGSVGLFVRKGSVTVRSLSVQE